MTPPQIGGKGWSYGDKNGFIQISAIVFLLASNCDQSAVFVALESGTLNLEIGLVHQIPHIKWLLVITSYTMWAVATCQ